MTINERQDEIIEEFEAFDDWIDRYQLISDYAKELKKHPQQETTFLLKDLEYQWRVTHTSSHSMRFNRTERRATMA